MDKQNEIPGKDAPGCANCPGVSCEPGSNATNDLGAKSSDRARGYIYASNRQLVTAFWLQADPGLDQRSRGNRWGKGKYLLDTHARFGAWVEAQLRAGLVRPDVAGSAKLDS